MHLLVGYLIPALLAAEIMARMRESMARLTPRFCASRAVREYTEKHYLRAAAAYHVRTADNGENGRQMVDWQRRLEQKWTTLRFGQMKVETNGELHMYEVQVYLNDLDPDAVRVELFADGINDSSSVRKEMQRNCELVGTSGGYDYSTAVPADCPTADYTARIIPYFNGVAIPLEDTRILWQR